MSDSNFTSSTQECSANTAEYVIQMPCEGSNANAKIATDTPTEFAFGVSDLSSMSLADGGGLLLTFANGSTLLLENFAEAKDAGGIQTVSFSDGTVMNMATLFETLEKDMDVAKGPQTPQVVNIVGPVGAIAGTALEFQYQDGTPYAIGFDKADVESTSLEGDVLTINFTDGTLTTLSGFGVDGTETASLTLEDGTVIPASDLIAMLGQSPVEAAQVTTQEEITDVQEIAQVEPAAGPKPTPQRVVQQNTQDSGSDVAQVEPAAGDTVTPAGAIGNTGANFNSEVGPGSIGGLNAIGPIGPTALQFDLPDQQTEEFIPQAGPAPAALQPPLLTINDVQQFEDTAVNFNIDASPNVPNANEVITITITDIPAGWTLVSPEGTYTPGTGTGTGTWTYTVPNGGTFTNGPTFMPPHDSDCDITNMNVTVTTLDTNTNQTSVTTDTMDVVIDAVADTPTLTSQNITTFEDTPAVLNASFALSDTDGSETLQAIRITGVPAGFTVGPNGTDMGGGVWNMLANLTTINNLTITPASGFSGTLNLTIESDVEETTLCGDEITTTNNVETTSVPFTVTFEAIADAPNLVVDNPVVDEDGSVFMNIDATLADTDGSETLTVTVTGIDSSWTVTTGANNGTYNAATGTWTITLPAGQNYDGGLTFTPPADSDVDMSNINVSATTTETSNNNTTTASTVVSILTDAIADAPTLTTSDVNGQSGNSFALNINGALTDTDGSETLSVYTISGLPAGFSLNQGTDQGGGTWTLTQAQLTGLQLNTPATFTGNVPLQVSVSSVESVTDGEVNLTNNTATTTNTINVSLSTTATPPTATIAGSHQVLEDGSVVVPFTATLNGSGNEVLTVTLTGIDSSWTVTTGANNGTYNSATGTWTITLPQGQNYNGSLTFTPPADSDVDLTGLQLTASAFDSTSNTTATDTATSEIIVDAVADAPTLTASNANGSSGSSIPLNITAGLTDTDGSETLSNITISGVPAGFSLNQGTDLGGGVWEVTQAQLSGLMINAPANVDTTFNLSVSVTTTEGVTDNDFNLTNNTATTTQTLQVDVVDAANPPSVNIAGSHQVLEDGSIIVPFSATLNGSPNEVLTVTLTGIDSSWGVTTGTNNGTYNAATGTWTITLPAGQNYNGSLTFTPPADSDVDMTGMTLTASAFEASSNTTETANATTQIIVDAVADAPTLSANNTSGTEGSSIPLTISAGLTDTDGSETLSNIRISGLPSGFSLNQGTDLGGGVWEVTQAQLGGLQLNTPNGYNGNVTLTASVTTTEGVTDTDFNLTNNTATTTDTFVITVNDTANPPTLNVDGVHQVLEDGSVFVPFSATLNGSSSEVLTVTVSGIDPSWTITTGANNGTYNSATGTWTITMPAGQNYTGGITFAPPADSDVDLTGIQVTANAHVPLTNTDSSVTEVVRVVVDAVADAPTIDATNSAGDAGTSIPLSITNALTDTDGSETLGNVTISGLPAGFSLNQGTDLGGGVWEVTQAQLTGLRLNTPGGYNGNVTLTASVTSTEGVTDNDFNLTNNTATTTDTFVVNVSNPVSPPTVNVSGTHQVLEDGSINVPFSATLNGGSGQTLTVTVTGIDSSWSVTTGSGNGTYNAATGTWTITMPADTNYNGGLIFTPPADSDVNMTGITVTASATDGSTTQSASENTQIVVDAVADAPLLNGTNTSGEAGTGIPLSITAGLTDTDGSETLSVITVTGVPAGFSLNKGTDQGGGTWTLTQAQLSGLKLNTPDGFDGNVTLGLSVTSTETITDTDFNLTNNTATTTDTITINVSDSVEQPTVNIAGQHQVLEDGSVVVPFSATLNGTGETLTVTLTGISAGWGVATGANNGTYNAATGTWTITMPQGQNYNGSLTLTPPADSDVDLTGLQLTATATKGGNSASDTEGSSVIVDAVADAPILAAGNAGGEAGNAIPLSISAGLRDTDGSETLSVITITGVPAGFSLNKGTNQGGGTWTLTQAQLNGLKLNTPDGFEGNVDLGVSVTSTEGVTDTDFNLTNNTATTTDTIRVAINDPVEQPTVNIAGQHQVLEDGSVVVPFSATLNGSGETLTVTLTGIGAGWGVATGANNGTYNAATGTWTITMPQGQNYNGSLTLTPPADSDVDLTGLQLTATATKGGNSASDTEGSSVIVDAVADAPTLNTNNAAGEAGDPIPLNISAALVDTDGSETLSNVTISGVPSGYTFNKGTDLGGGKWSFTQSDLSGLTITPPGSASGVVNLTVAVTTTEGVTDTDFNLTNNTATTTRTLSLTVDPDDKPVFNPFGSVNVDEADLDNGTVTVNGSVTANFGNDGPGTYCIPNNGTFSATGFVLGTALSSGGFPVSVTASGGNTYTGTANGQTVFTFVMNTDGTFSFKQFGPLDHSNTNSDSEEIHLNFQICAEDSDGDTTMTTITVNVQDDGIVAADDWVCIPTCDSAVNGNVLTGSNPNVGNKADDLSVDVANKLIGIYDKDGNYHEFKDGKPIVVEGAFDNKLYIYEDGTYSYDVNFWGTDFDLNPTSGDFVLDRPQLTRDGITLTVGTPLYGGQSKGQLTWTNGGIGITGNGNNKINPGEALQIDFAGSGVYNAAISLGGISAGTKIIDYCVQLTLCDGSTRVVFGQKAIMVNGGNATLTLDTWNDFTDPDVVSINTIHIFSENDTPFSYVVTDVAAQSHLYDEFRYVVQDGDGDTDEGTLHLSANATGTTFNPTTVYVGANRTDPGDGLAEGDGQDNLVLGWTRDDSLLGKGGNDTLAGWTGDDELYGGAGNDILMGEAGSDDLYGGSGSDIFVVDASDGGAVFDHIKDFNANQGDVIDLSEVIDNFNSNTSDITDYVRVVNSGGKAMIQVNADGAGNDWQNAIMVDNHTAANVDIEQLFQNGNIDVT